MYSSIEGFLVTHLRLVPVELGKNYCIFLKCNQKRSWDTQEGVLWESCSWLWVSVALLKIKPVRVGGKGRSHSFLWRILVPFLFLLMPSYSPDVAFLFLFLPGMTSLYPPYILGWASHVFYHLTKDWISLLGSVSSGEEVWYRGKRS